MRSRRGRWCKSTLPRAPRPASSASYGWHFFEEGSRWVRWGSGLTGEDGHQAVAIGGYERAVGSQGGSRPDRASGVEDRQLLTVGGLQREHVAAGGADVKGSVAVQCW